MRARRIVCFSPRDNPKQIKLCTQWIFVKWTNEWLNTAVNISTMFACAHSESFFEVHNQKWNCWVLGWIGLPISLSNAVILWMVASLLSVISIWVLSVYGIVTTILSDLKIVVYLLDICHYCFNYLLLSLLLAKLCIFSNVH